MQHDAFVLSSHRHDQHQLLVANQGVITLVAPDRICVAPPGHAIWVPAGTTHATEMVKAGTSLSFLLDESLCSRPGARCEVIDVDNLLRELLQAAATPYSDNAAHKALLIALLVEEIPRADGTGLDVPLPQTEPLARVCQSLIANLHMVTTIDQLALQLGMNRRSFTRMFRRETGLSFCAWLARARVTAALPRLRAGDAISAIATELGYQRVSSFSTAFKRVFREPPSFLNS